VPGGRSLPSSLPALVALGIIVFLVVLPTAWLVFGSFWSSDIGLPGTLTLKNYEEVFSNAYTWRILYNSLAFASTTVLLTLALAIPLSWIITRTNTPGRQYLSVLILVPFVVGGLLSSAGWIFLASPALGMLNKLVLLGFHLKNPPLNIFSLAGMTWVEATGYVPLAFLIISAALVIQDQTLEEASKMSGASTLRSIRHVTLPLIRPAILASAVLIFIRAAGDFEVPAMLGLPVSIRVLSTQIYSFFSEVPPVNGEGTADAMILVVVGAIMIYLYRRFIRGAERFQTFGGRGGILKPTDLGRWRYFTFSLAVVYVFVTAILPLIAVSIASVVPFWRNNALASFSFDSWTSVLSNSEVKGAVLNTIILTVVGASAAVLLTSFVAFILIRSKSRARGPLEFLVFVPLAFPGIALAVGLLWAYIYLPIPIYGTLWILLLSYVTLYMPLAFRSLYANILQINAEMEEASRMSGSSQIRTFFTVTFPLIRNGLVAAWILMAMSMVRELSSSILLYNEGTEVLSIPIFHYYQVGRYQELSVMTILLTVMTILLLVAVIKGTKSKLVI
jgi:iron(III) transport system permease protein